MINRLIFILLIATSWPVSYSQEVDKSLDPIDTSGISYPVNKPSTAPVGRISGYAGLGWSTLGPMYDGGMRYSFKNNGAIRFSVAYSSFYSAHIQSDFWSNYQSSRLIQSSLVYEYYFVGGNDRKKNGDNNASHSSGDQKLSLYGFGGIGADVLAPAGQAKARVVIPVGLGMTYRIGEHATIGIEIRGRYAVSGGTNSLYYPGYSGLWNDTGWNTWGGGCYGGSFNPGTVY